MASDVDGTRALPPPWLPPRPPPLRRCDGWASRARGLGSAAECEAEDAGCCANARANACGSTAEPSLAVIDVMVKPGPPVADNLVVNPWGAAAVAATAATADAGRRSERGARPPCGGRSVAEAEAVAGKRAAVDEGDTERCVVGFAAGGGGVEPRVGERRLPRRPPCGCCR